MGRFGGGVLPRPLACLAVLTLWGCTSVDTEAEHQIAEQRLPRPAMILVHDFAVSPDEVSRPALVERQAGPGHRQDRG